MPSPPRTPDAHVLLLHDAFLRRVARGLVQATDADDLVQATYARALAAGPRTDKPVHAWLRVIAQRLAWRWGTRESSLRAREARARRPASVPTPETVLEREEERHHVIRAVLALPDRDREVLILRYLEDLSLGEVAVTLGLPVETVRTRQKRALARLRAKLERDPPRSLGALLLLAPPARAGATSLFLGGLVVKKALAVGAVLGLVALLVAVIVSSGNEAAETPSERDGRLVVEGPHLLGRTSEAAEATGGGPATADPTEPADAQLSILVRDRVTGFPLGSAFARVPTPTSVATWTAEASGRIRVHTRPPADGRLPTEVCAEGYVGARLTLTVGPAAAPEVHEVALPPLSSLRSWRMLAGRVVNAHGRPVEGAVVWSADMSWWTYETQLVSTVSDAEGRFELRYPMDGGGRDTRCVRTIPPRGMVRTRRGTARCGVRCFGASASPPGAPSTCSRASASCCSPRAASRSQSKGARSTRRERTGSRSVRPRAATTPPSPHPALGACATATRSLSASGSGRSSSARSTPAISSQRRFTWRWTRAARTAPRRSPHRAGTTRRGRAARRSWSCRSRLGTDVSCFGFSRGACPCPAPPYASSPRRTRIPSSSSRRTRRARRDLRIGHPRRLSAGASPTERPRPSRHDGRERSRRLRGLGARAGDTWSRGSHMGIHQVELGTVRVARGENRRRVEVPTREP